MHSYPCPCCGFLTFGEPPGSYEICDVCGWEDDHVQLAHPACRCGANGESLLEAQVNAIKQYPLSVTRVNGFERDPEWRPLSDKELRATDVIPQTGLDYFHAATEEEPGYYWRA